MLHLRYNSKLWYKITYNQDWARLIKLKLMTMNRPHFKSRVKMNSCMISRKQMHVMRITMLLLHTHWPSITRWLARIPTLHKSKGKATKDPIMRPLIRDMNMCAQTLINIRVECLCLRPNMKVEKQNMTKYKSWDLHLYACLSSVHCSTHNFVMVIRSSHRD